MVGFGLEIGEVEMKKIIGKQGGTLQRTALVLLILVSIIVNLRAATADGVELALRKHIISSAETIRGSQKFSGGSFIRSVYSSNGITLPNSINTAFSQGNAIHPSEALPGDIIFFSLKGSKSPDHAGLYLGSGRFMHPEPGSNKIIISRISKSNVWGQKYLSVREYRSFFAKGRSRYQGQSAKLSDFGSSVNTTSVSLPSTQSSSASGIRAKIVANAKSFQGVPYLWGGTTPSGFDCSGFVQYVYKQNGISIPRNSRSQSTAGTHIHPKEAQPGDLIFFYGEVKGHVSHVAMYIGNGEFIHAPCTGKTISISTIKKEKYWGKRFVSVRSYVP